MPIIGYRDRATEEAPVALEADHKYLTKVAVTEEMRVPKLSAKLDGLGVLSGDPQMVKGLIYDEAGERVTQSLPSPVVAGSAATWIDFIFPDAGGAVLAPGDYELGLLADVPTKLARLATVDNAGARAIGADTYGSTTTTLSEATTLPAATINVASTTGFDSAGVIVINGIRIHYTSKEATKFKGCTGGGGVIPTGTTVVQEGAGLRNQPSAPTGAEGEFRIFATYFAIPPVPEVDDLHIARYPFGYAQEVLRLEPPLEGTASVGQVTWHGTVLNPERGSVALVQRDGRYTDLIGERVLLTNFNGRSVAAYVLNEAGLGEGDDLSVTRRLFMQLAPLATEALNCKIEVLSAQGEA